jgi:hypothetical protein
MHHGRSTYAAPDAHGYPIRDRRASAEGTEHDQEHEQQPAEGERYMQRNASGGGVLGTGGSLVKELAYQSLRWHCDAVRDILGIGDADLQAVLDDLSAELHASL